MMRDGGTSKERRKEEPCNVQYSLHTCKGVFHGKKDPVHGGVIASPSLARSDASVLALVPCVIPDDQQRHKNADDDHPVALKL